jgi:hypothetical protein
MSISSLFAKLGAPLQNTRWSWGAVRKADSAVFLRVWQDRMVVENRVAMMMITHHEKYTEDPDNLGYQERLEHVRLVRDGTKCYLIMCEAKDIHAVPREIKTYNDREVFVGGEVREMRGDTWVKIADRLRVSAVQLP